MRSEFHSVDIARWRRKNGIFHSRLKLDIGRLDDQSWPSSLLSVVIDYSINDAMKESILATSPKDLFIFFPYHMSYIPIIRYFMTEKKVKHHRYLQLMT